jgi:tetratricopeptide (TPR) repeat protein
VNARILNRPFESLAHYDAALGFDHRPELYFERGLTLLELGRKQEAIQNIATSARFDPHITDDLDPLVREQVLAELRN